MASAENKNQSGGEQKLAAPSISLPKGGGAIRGMGEKFAANPVTGTGSMTVPIATSPGRSGFGPQLSLSYDSGSGNGPFGIGWSLSLPQITRKTDKGLPRYWDAEESDEFILSGAEDLVPVLEKKNGQWERQKLPPRTMNGKQYDIRHYQPRIEGLFARIERWTNRADPKDTFWRSISKDNITTWYGKTENSRIFDPDPKCSNHIFSWLICQSYDDKGNAIIYEHLPEDSTGIDLSQAHEKNRTELNCSANRYLKRIKYGNLQANRDDKWQVTDPTELKKWMFEVVFDYGEGHYTEQKAPDAKQYDYALAQIDPPANSVWPVRQDPFSTYRAGFEVRTYRLCHRVLMLHHFPDELDGVEDYLVRSTEFTYDPNPIASFITSATQSGYKYKGKKKYLKKSLPPLQFEYSKVPDESELAKLPIQKVDPESLQNLPVGLDGTTYQWMDLDGEGTSGILTEQADAWFYKRNLSANNQIQEDGQKLTRARFGPTELVATKPVIGLADGAQFLDLAGDGQVDLVLMDGPVKGFYERIADAEWSPFKPFKSWPNLNIHDPNLKFTDLTGDGHADILITETEAITWHPSLSEQGFGPAVRVSVPLDEEQGPRIIFNDGTQSIYLADLSGDGLTDLVRIRNDEICYWPNLGYGRFGAKVTMDNSPRFDRPEQFDQRRIRLADIDGSGTTDIIYLRNDGVQIYFNQSGNRWSNRVPLPQFPPVDNLSSVQTLDLLGNGTACLVWSSSLPGNSRRPMCYIALMPEKPHLLTKTVNNLGVETVVQYAPSTKFYLKDKEEGKPWITRLPFPVHVVERVETYDHISRNRFVTSYAYHHGYFDGEEREFRGFGMVEQWDTEEFGFFEARDLVADADNIDKAFHVPPVLTKTWFHTGAYIEGRRISKQFESKYYREGDESRGLQGLSDEAFCAMELTDTILPATILLADGKRIAASFSADEEREACRALKGSILRQEIYALDRQSDGSPTEESDRPYSVSERSYTIECLQPRATNRHVVFFCHPHETIDFHYERRLFPVKDGKLVRDPDQAQKPDVKWFADPRVSHSMTLEVDLFGNVLRTAAIGYGRRFDDPDPVLTDKDKTEQKQLHCTYSENGYTNAIQLDDDYRTPLITESRTYEILNVMPDANLPNINNVFRFDELDTKLRTAGDGDHEIPYEDIDAADVNDSKPWRRLIERVRTLYRENNLTTLLPLGSLDSMALPGESYKLAFTPGLAKQIYVDPGKVSQADLDSVLSKEGGYVHSDGDSNSWIPTGRVFYQTTANVVDPAATAIAELEEARKHFFLPRKYADPFGNCTNVTYDTYDFLITETRDALINEVAATNDYRVLQPALITDPNGNRTAALFDCMGLVVVTAVMGKEGENLGDLPEGVVPDPPITELQDFVANPAGKAAEFLGRATTRIVYDLERFQRCGQPPFAATLSRETHFHDPGGDKTKIQISFSYSDGFGREIQKKIQAESGAAPQRMPAVSLDSSDVKPGDLVRDVQYQPLSATTSSRWVSTGRTVFNNKGKPVKKYEPFFSSIHIYEPETDITDTGVTPVLFYDPLERVIATLHPNHTYEKVCFDPWRQITYDVNDTMAWDPRSDPDISGYVEEYFKQEAPPPRVWKTWLQQREIDPDNPPEDRRQLLPEKKAGVRALKHADTPTIAHLDTLGRTFLTVADNGKDQDGKEIFFCTRVVLDIEGNQHRVIDAKDRIVMIYDYYMAGPDQSEEKKNGNLIHQSSMEAGERWILNDVTGKPIRKWDSRGHEFKYEYDALRRPLKSYVAGVDATAPKKKILFEKTEYGENLKDNKGILIDKALNLRTRIYRHYDGAGIVTNLGKNEATNKNEAAYDFKGNLLRTSRQMAKDYATTPDWSKKPDLDAETFESSTTYDALNRPITVTTPDNSIYRPLFNEANLLDKVEVNLRGAGGPTSFVTNIDYNAKGQRERITYGNGACTSYEYDPATFRLTKMMTTRPANQDIVTVQLLKDPTRVQDLSYYYDPAGNIIQIEDKALKTIFYDGQQIDSIASYTYDAIYRLIKAEGREHIGQTVHEFAPPDGNRRDFDFKGLADLAHTNDMQALRNFTEQYIYDAVGNFDSVHHSAGNGSWNRRYIYDEKSLIEQGRKSNRLTMTILGNSLNRTETYAYQDGLGVDVHGCMTSINSMKMVWDFRDQLQKVDLSGGGTAFYVYDAGGQRVRKVIESQNGMRQKERIYLGNYEVYREYSGGDKPKLERESLHVIDDKQRIALVETKTKESGLSSSLTSSIPVIRFQLGNHLGSASLELSADGGLVSYEEYHPYGTSSFQVGSSAAEVSLKRYRYTGKERDEETGLYYHGARYYAPWVGRWTHPDPKYLGDGPNLYEYVGNRPTIMSDPQGTQGLNLVESKDKHELIKEEGKMEIPTKNETTNPVSPLLQRSNSVAIREKCLEIIMVH